LTNLITLAKNFHDKHSERKYKLNGLHFQDNELCKTRLWLGANGVNCSRINKHMLSGKSIHKNDFVQSGFGLAPDFIDWKKHVVIERKNSQSYEAATIMQLLFYMTMLTATTEIIWSGNIQYIRSKQLKEVILSEENIKKLDKSAEEIHAILFLKSPPFSNEKNICKQCSFGLLCFGSTDQEWEE